VDEEIEREDRHPGDNAVRVRGSRSLTVLLIAGVIVGAVVWLIGAVVYWVRMIGTDLDPLSPANPGRWIPVVPGSPKHRPSPLRGVCGGPHWAACFATLGRRCPLDDRTLVTSLRSCKCEAAFNSVTDESTEERPRP
jgi:hypothetical protein